MNVIECLQKAARYPKLSPKNFRHSVSVDIVTNFTDTLLERLLIGTLLAENIYPDVRRSPYEGYRRFLLSKPKRKAAVTFLLFDVNHFVHSPFRADPKELGALSAVIERFGAASASLVFAGTIVPPYASAYGNRYADDPLFGAVQRFNGRLADIAKRLTNFHLFDIGRLMNRFGEERARNHRDLYAFDVSFTNEFFLLLAHELSALIKTSIGKSKKCIVLDLDNTLWGGVAGESNLEEIAVGGAYPGNVYQSLQRLLKTFYDRGVILAINSKNNIADVKEIFSRHGGMHLSLSHFASVQANWGDKVANLKRIAAELNIGTDSMIFIDDDPLNRELVRQAMPEVSVIDFVSPPVDLIKILATTDAFHTLRLTEEDRRRGEQYAAERKRSALKSEAKDYGGYLKSLDISLEVRLNAATEAPRLSQLSQKTNQFNLTTLRYGEKTLRRLMKKNFVFSGRVRDKFGDYGIAALGVVTRKKRQASIEALLMSCRVMGRDVEFAFLSAIIKHLKKRGVKKMTALFVPTAKNAPAQKFFERAGWTVDGQSGDAWRYSLDLSGAKLPSAPSFVKILP